MAQTSIIQKIQGFQHYYSFIVVTLNLKEFILKNIKILDQNSLKIIIQKT